MAPMAVFLSVFFVAAVEWSSATRMAPPASPVLRTLPSGENDPFVDMLHMQEDVIGANFSRGSQDTLGQESPVSAPLSYGQLEETVTAESAFDRSRRVLQSSSDAFAPRVDLAMLQKLQSGTLGKGAQRIGVGPDASDTKASEACERMYAQGVTLIGLREFVQVVDATKDLKR
ncbi:unnamed protein product [Vitrella brassicaformis CCMP3155]|uniref:Uncharacterized protein n=1 Tax=Vitrella brassicaformis (strain CCMP3155) TaxID=1169540 RepID=A0A0G4EJA3_VITBC|nr:unnamed protein product [Vitrella brassicaformis CCMP3155]|eukprot:CEL97098.1 unnamed protein product [Vitrella brassicaformis CCMP3155]